MVDQRGDPVHTHPILSHKFPLLQMKYMYTNIIIVTYERPIFVNIIGKIDLELMYNHISYATFLYYHHRIGRF